MCFLLTLQQDKYTEDSKMRAVEIFMCSILKKQGYGEGKLNLIIQLMDFVDGNDRVQILLDLTRNGCEKCNYTSSGRNRTCGPAIPVQCSNQLSYTESSCRVLTTSSCIYIL